MSEAPSIRIPGVSGTAPVGNWNALRNNRAAPTVRGSQGADETFEILHVEWLREDPARAELQRSRGHVGRAKRSHHDDGGGRCRASDLLEESQIVGIRKAQVQKNDDGFGHAGQSLQRGRRVLRFGDAVTGGAERLADAPPDQRLVVDDEDVT